MAYMLFMFQLWHLYVSYMMFHMLHEMLTTISIKMLCDFIYVLLLK